MRVGPWCTYCMRFMHAQRCICRTRHGGRRRWCCGATRTASRLRWTYACRPAPAAAAAAPPPRRLRCGPALPRHPHPAAVQLWTQARAAWFHQAAYPATVIGTTAGGFPPPHPAVAATHATPVPCMPRLRPLAAEAVWKSASVGMAAEEGLVGALMMGLAGPASRRRWTRGGWRGCCRRSRRWSRTSAARAGFFTSPRRCATMCTVMTAVRALHGSL